MGKHRRTKTTNGQIEPDYWTQSIQPLNCLIFIAPLLLLYEVGVVWMGPEAMRNGADVWLRGFLSGLGFGEYVFLPLATCILLFGLHHVSRADWRWRSDVLSGMVCECFALGLCVLLLAQLYSHCVASTSNPETTSITIAWTETSGEREDQLLDDSASPKKQRVTTTDPNLDWFPLSTMGEVAEKETTVAKMLSFLGAGIYEELLFRFVLLTGTFAICCRAGIDRTTAIVFAVLSTSLFFSAAHYRLFCSAGLEFTWYSFTFRLLAGTLFSILYWYRGFGIVVGTHAVYDILAATFIR